MAAEHLLSLWGAARVFDGRVYLSRWDQLRSGQLTGPLFAREQLFTEQQLRRRHELGQQRQLLWNREFVFRHKFVGFFQQSVTWVVSTCGASKQATEH